VIQGFGKWSLVDSNWIIPRYISDLEVKRQIIRFILPILIIVFGARAAIERSVSSPLVKLMLTVQLSIVGIFLGTTFQVPPGLLLLCGLGLLAMSLIPSRGSRQGRKITKENDEAFLELFCATQLVFVLTVMGHYEWYWNLRREVAVLNGFREPWAKFSQPYVILLISCFCIICDRFIRSNLFIQTKTIRYSFWTILIAVSAFLGAPSLNREAPTNISFDRTFEPPSVSEWRQADLILSRTEKILREKKICILNLDPRGLIQGLMRTKFPTNTTINRKCIHSKEYVKIVIPNTTNSLGIQTETITELSFCFEFRADELYIIEEGCTLRVVERHRSVLVEPFALEPS
jgi:hypothetical protein